MMDSLRDSSDKTEIFPRLNNKKRTEVILSLIHNFFERRGFYKIPVFLIILTKLETALKFCPRKPFFVKFQYADVKARRVR